MDLDDDCRMRQGQCNEQITSLVKEGRHKAALESFESMCSGGVTLNAYAVSIALSACVTLETVQIGMQIHAIFVMDVAEVSFHVTSTLINMYLMCGSLGDAQNVYDRMKIIDVVCFNALLAGYIKHGYPEDAINLYKSLYTHNVTPNDVTFTITLSACVKTKDLTFCQQLHSDILSISGNTNMHVDNVLIDVYGKCGSVDNAWHVFSKMTQHDTISWAVLITAHSKHGLDESAFKLFDQMLQEGAHPCERTMVGILGACSSVIYVKMGRRLHALIESSDLQTSSVVCSAVVDMYTKCRSMESAMHVFERISKSDVVLWNIILAANAKQGFAQEAVELFDRMHRHRVSPNQITFLTICHVCGSLGDIEKSREIHSCILKAGISTDLSLGSGLIDMYAKCKCLDDAVYVFDRHSKKDVVCWTAIIAGNVHQERFEDAFRLFDLMYWEGVHPNHVTFLALLNAVSCAGSLIRARQFHCQMIAVGIKFNAVVANTLISMYGKCGASEMACQIFNDISKADAISWNTMIAACIKNNFIEEALKLFSQMTVEGVIPDKVTYINVLDAWNSEVPPPFKEGKQIHVMVLSTEFYASCFVASSLINMYGKCGSLDFADEVLRKLVKRDVVSWGALITAYAQHGHGKKALALSAQMSREGIRMSQVTLLSILSACSHAGLVKEGWCFFETVSRQHGVRLSEKHYACMVDLLCRAGCLEEAYDLIEKMQIQQSASLWMSLLSACRPCGNVDLATKAAEKVHALRPNSAAPFQLLYDTHLYMAARLAE